MKSKVTVDFVVELDPDRALNSVVDLVCEDALRANVVLEYQIVASKPFAGSLVDDEVYS